MQIVAIRVAKGRRVRRAPREGGAVLEPGRVHRVPLSTYWRRRLAAGDVVRAEPERARPKRRSALPAEE